MNATQKSASKVAATVDGITLYGAGGSGDDATWASDPATDADRDLSRKLAGQDSDATDDFGWLFGR